MKLLTFTVPCYNSASYMRKCIDSLLPGGDFVEILIVDDGSAKDNTAEIADEYEAKYPGIVRAIHQPNKGHGGAVNTGIANATGIYFKVVDSDDWVDGPAYAKVLDALNKFKEPSEQIDMLLANFVYENESALRKRKMIYRGYFPEGRVFGWEDTHRLPSDKYLMMHAIFYRTELLRQNNIVLPEHTFYVDNIFVTSGLRYVKKMYYVDACFYRYFIGRADQSVKESNLIKNLGNQFAVTEAIVDMLLDMPRGTGAKQCDRMILDYCISCITVCVVFTYRSGSADYAARLMHLWEQIATDQKLEKKIHSSALIKMITIPGEFGKMLASKGYEIYNTINGAN